MADAGLSEDGQDRGDKDRRAEDPSAEDASADSEAAEEPVGAELRQEIETMLGDFRQKLAADTARLRVERKERIEALRRDVNEMLVRSRDELARRVADERNARQESLQRIRAEVNALRVSHQQNVERLAEHAQQRVQAEQARRAQVRTADSVGGKVAIGKTGSSAYALFPDKLTEIDGIGSALQERLNQAGIYTFVQLARCTEEQISSAIGRVSALAQVGEWIESAKRRIDPSNKSAREPEDKVLGAEEKR